MSEDPKAGATPARPGAPVWKKRYSFLYYRYVHEMVAAVGANARSVLDVGSNNAPYLDRFDWIPRKVSLDKGKPYQSDHVVGIKEDFFKWEPESTFDLVLCLQVLEHVKDPRRFMKRLFRAGPHVLVSVPYLWPENSSRGHVQDPVDEHKLRRWAGCDPNFSVIVTEPEARARFKARRLIAYYDLTHPEARPEFPTLERIAPGRVLGVPGPQPEQREAIPPHEEAHRTEAHRTEAHRTEAHRTPRLILHAGWHKTATTAIQAFSHRNRKALRSRGLLYPALPRGRGGIVAHHRFAHAISGSQRDITVQRARELAGQWAAKAGASGQTVFMSVESVCRHLDPATRGSWETRRRAYLRNFAGLLSGCDVEVVLVLRRQDDFIKSMYQEHVTRATSLGALQFSEFRPRLINSTRYLDNLAIFEEVFPKVKVLVYEDLPRGEALVTRFFEAIGVDVAGLPPVGIVHQSHTVRETLVKRFFNQHLPGREHNAAVLKWLSGPTAQALIGEHFEGQDGDLWESREARIEFAARFDAENDALKTRYFPGRERLFPLWDSTAPMRAATLPPALETRLLAIIEDARGASGFALAS